MRQSPPPQPPPIDGFRCELCGYEVVGDGAKDKFRDHIELHQERERNAGWRSKITMDDRVFLKVQKILWIDDEDLG